MTTPQDAAQVTRPRSREPTPERPDTAVAEIPVADGKTIAGASRSESVGFASPRAGAGGQTSAIQAAVADGEDRTTVADLRGRVGLELGPEPKAHPSS